MAWGPGYLPSERNDTNATLRNVVFMSCETPTLRICYRNVVRQRKFEMLWTMLAQHRQNIIFYNVSLCYMNIAQSVARTLRLMLLKGIVGNVRKRRCHDVVKKFFQYIVKKMQHQRCVKCCYHVVGNVALMHLAMYKANVCTTSA